MSRCPHWETWTHNRLLCKCAVAVACAIESSSVSSYSSAVMSYFDFCSSHALPVDPTPNTLSFTLYICPTTSSLDRSPPTFWVFVANLNLFSLTSDRIGVIGSLQRLLKAVGRCFLWPYHENGPSLGLNLLLFLKNMPCQPPSTMLSSAPSYSLASMVYYA